MLYSALTLLTLTALSLASPSTRLAQSQSKRDASCIEVTFIGAAGAQYTQSIPFNSQFTATNDDLSISHITTSGGPCVFFGVDGGVLVSFGSAESQDFGPPQTVAGAICGPWSW